MGAGLFAANMSTTFRMRKFGAADALPYGIDYQVVGGVDEQSAMLLDASALSPNCDGSSPTRST